MTMLPVYDGVYYPGRCISYLTPLGYTTRVMSHCKFVNKKSRFIDGVHCIQPVAPVAYQVIVEPGVGQFREFEPRRVHARINFVGNFSCAKIDLQKARERELATLDEKSTSSGIAEPYAR